MRISKSTIISLLALTLILVGIPLAIFSYEAHRSGQTLAEYLAKTLKKIGAQDTSHLTIKSVQGETIDFLKKVTIGDPVGEAKPWITHVAIVDLDKDGLKDVILCDAKLNEVRWIRQSPAGTYTESKVGDTVRGPAHVTPSDIDKDGDIDLLVAQMSIIVPENDKIGAVVIMENIGNEKFVNHVIVDNVARVCDVEPGDFDNDGDIDLVVAQFGYDDGEIRWMENKGNWQFESHILQNLSGPIHALVEDIDKDGDLDIIALVAQEWEEIYIFENDGHANFKTNLVYGSTNEDFGSSGISLVDLDKDGDKDILFTNGDAFDYLPPGPRPWHGVQWLENKGNLKFEYHRIGNFAGAYFANGVDIDRDGDIDIAVVSAFNKWDDPKSQSMIWFENDGQMNFIRRNITSSPTHLLVLASDDMDGDGWVDFVTAGMHVYPPYDRLSRITLWKNIWPKRKTVEE
ncbi:MAG: VCBS repeat-containing protein [Planctomycetes bacterium]|nr:VCBS repeat-containing protein [Planctomycetota bacterium]